VGGGDLERLGVDQRYLRRRRSTVDTEHVFGPGPQRTAQAAVAPEVTPEEWAALADELRQQLEDLPQPETDEEKELVEQLEELENLLEQQPEKKDALAAVAKLLAELEAR
jgi:hypothetical protein